MHRRGLLAGGGVAALLGAAAGWPGWLRKAFSKEEVTPTDDRASDPHAPGAMRRPEAPLEPGQRLLFLVIPDDDDQRYERGHAFGEFLNHGKSADLARLSGVTVECATLASINERLGGSLRGSPLVVLATAEAATTRLQAAERPLPPLPGSRRGGAADESAEEAILDQRIAAVAAALREVLGEVTGDAEAKAREVRERVVKRPLRGGQWASDSGCGLGYEEGPEQGEAIDCGMGHVPEKSVRFLHFLAARAARP